MVRRDNREEEKHFADHTPDIGVSLAKCKRQIPVRPWVLQLQKFL